MQLTANYRENVEAFSRHLRVDENFDLIRRTLRVGTGELTLFYVDGFTKDGILQKLMQYFLGLDGVNGTAGDFAESNVPYVEVETSGDFSHLSLMVLSGAAVMFGTSFGAEGIVIDSRTYPARSTEEPDTDRVMAGAHDGFVETLIYNTALIRRRIRDPRLTMHYVSIGGGSRTDLAVCYLSGKADEEYVRRLVNKLASLHPESLTMGSRSLEECLIRRRWYNPFPKIRRLERPDAAAAEVMEGRVLIICDTSPQVMVLPTSIFDFLQETDDYYFPPLTGCYLRVIRHGIFWLSLLLTPLWYLALQAGTALPPALHFLLPEQPGTIPILLQLYLAEFAIDGLKLASMNTPNMLSNSLSVIGGLILGDFAVTVGWFCPEVIFYMAVVVVAGFTQRSYELTYAFKFFRMVLLGFCALWGWWGFGAGLLLIFLLLVSNKTVNGRHSYLYPVVPFNARGLGRLYFRLKKSDVHGTDGGQEGRMPDKKS